MTATNFTGQRSSDKAGITKVCYVAAEVRKVLQLYSVSSLAAAVPNMHEDTATLSDHGPVYQVPGRAALTNAKLRGGVSVKRAMNPVGYTTHRSNVR